MDKTDRGFSYVIIKPCYELRYVLLPFYSKHQTQNTAKNFRTAHNNNFHLSAPFLSVSAKAQPSNNQHGSNNNNRYCIRKQSGNKHTRSKCYASRASRVTASQKNHRRSHCFAAISVSLCSLQYNQRRRFSLLLFFIFASSHSLISFACSIITQ